MNHHATPPTPAYIVLRALAMGGQRVDVGSLLDLTPSLGQELAAAGKVRVATPDEISTQIAAEASKQMKAAMGTAVIAAQAVQASKAKPSA
jgi:hypothetical protein